MTAERAHKQGSRVGRQLVRKDPEPDHAKAGYDYDDGTAAGVAASVSQRRSIARVVRRYYVAALARDGKAACSVIAEQPNEWYGQSSEESSGASRRSCPGLLTKLFAQYRARFVREGADTRILAIRVEGEFANAFQRWHDGRLGRTQLQREAGGWRILTPRGQEVS
jgi:hypothetical protein